MNTWNWLLHFLIIFDLVAFGIYFGGDILFTAISKVQKKSKKDDDLDLYDFEIETAPQKRSLCVDSIRMLYSGEIDEFVEKEQRLAVLYFRWDEVAPLLRGMYARQLDGFGQERPEPAVESPTFHSETVAVYPGDKNNLPYALNSHPAVLDGFIDLVREEQQRSRTQGEKIQPSRPSVRDKLKQELPAHKPAAPKKQGPER